jgi:hypothetical protein
MQQSTVMNADGYADDPQSGFFEPTVEGRVYQANAILGDMTDGTESYYTLQEVRELSAFLNTGKNKPLMAQHMPGRQIGQIVGSRVDDEGWLVVKASLQSQDIGGASARRMREKLQRDEFTGFSIGYNPRLQRDPITNRYQKLFREISIVDVPALPGASFSRVRASADGAVVVGGETAGGTRNGGAENVQHATSQRSEMADQGQQPPQQADTHMDTPGQGAAAEQQQQQPPPQQDNSAPAGQNDPTKHMAVLQAMNIGELDKFSRQEVAAAMRYQNAQYTTQMGAVTTQSQRDQEELAGLRTKDAAARERHQQNAVKKVELLVPHLQELYGDKATDQVAPLAELIADQKHEGATKLVMHLNEKNMNSQQQIQELMAKLERSESERASFEGRYSDTRDALLHASSLGSASAVTEAAREIAAMAVMEPAAPKDRGNGRSTRMAEGQPAGEPGAKRQRVVQQQQQQQPQQQQQQQQQQQWQPTQQQQAWGGQQQAQQAPSQIATGPPGALQLNQIFGAGQQAGAGVTQLPSHLTQAFADFGHPQLQSADPLMGGPLPGLQRERQFAAVRAGRGGASFAGLAGGAGSVMSNSWNHREGLLAIVDQLCPQTAASAHGGPGTMNALLDQAGLSHQDYRGDRPVTQSLLHSVAQGLDPDKEYAAQMQRRM